jgi:septal ring factor EnvC (AmiA/AmiB activator)
MPATPAARPDGAFTSTRPYFPGRLRWACLVLGLAGLGGITAPLPAVTQESVARAPDLRAELDRLADERASVVRDFEAADVELALRRQQLEILQRRGTVLAEEGAASAAAIDEFETALVSGREQLRRRVEVLYRVGPLSYNRLLLTADTSQEALIAYQIVTYLAARDRDLVASVRENVAELQAARESLAATTTGLAAVEADTAAATTALVAQQEERQRLLSRIDREAEAQRIALASAERAELELAGTFGELAERTEGTAGFRAARGQLAWPVTGRVITGFGRQRHPLYDTYTVSRGIEIDAPLDDPVTAVHAGRVAFADWYSGYGLLVIVDHGSNYFTLYGHLASVAVRVNDRIAAGQLVGKVGETGSLTGPNLYFEVREGADALNPTSWLQRR